MTKKQKSSPSVPVDPFAAAFCKLLKVNRGEIEIQLDEKGHQALVLFNGEHYKVATWDALQDEMEQQITDIDAAQHINLNVWIDVTKNTVTIGRFLPALLNKIRSVEEANLVNIALSLNSYSEDQYATFWKVLASIDKEGTVFGNAILSAREVYDGDGLLEDLTETMIMFGKDTYVLLQDGIFETVYHISGGTGYTFYIFSTAY